MKPDLSNPVVREMLKDAYAIIAKATPRRGFSLSPALRYEFERVLEIALERY